MSEVQKKMTASLEFLKALHPDAGQHLKNVMEPALKGIEAMQEQSGHYAELVAAMKEMDKKKDERIANLEGALKASEEIEKLTEQLLGNARQQLQSLLQVGR